MGSIRLPVMSCGLGTSMRVHVLSVCMIDNARQQGPSGNQHRVKNTHVHLCSTRTFPVVRVPTCTPVVPFECLRHSSNP